LRFGGGFPGLASQASGWRHVATENTSQCSIEEKLENGKRERETEPEP